LGDYSGGAIKADFKGGTGEEKTQQKGNRVGTDRIYRVQRSQGGTEAKAAERKDITQI